MKYKWQVIHHQPYYPSSSLFETEEEARKHFDELMADKRIDLDYEVLTLCQIVESLGELGYDAEQDWIR